MAGRWKAGEIAAVCVSPVKAYPKLPQEYAVVTPQGIVGDAHAGPTRRSQDNPSVEKPNDRALSIVAFEVLQEVNEMLGLRLVPGSFNENLSVRGMGDLSDLRVGDRLVVDTEENVTITVTRQNYPCKLLEDFNGAGLIKALIRKIDGEVCNKRGVLGIADGTAVIRPGDRIIAAQSFLEVLGNAARQFGLPSVPIQNMRADAYCALNARIVRVLARGCNPREIQELFAEIADTLQKEFPGAGSLTPEAIGRVFDNVYRYRWDA